MPRNIFVYVFGQAVYLPLSHCLRKEKQLYFTKAVRKIADIPSYVLAVSLAGIVKDLTPQSLFRTGGELFEAR